MLKIRFEKDWSRAAWNIYAFESGGQMDRISYRLTLEALAPVPRIQSIEPAVRLSMDNQEDFVGALIEGLAEAGLIPKMGATEAELTATKKHLEDMRAMAFEEVKPAPKLA